MCNHSSHNAADSQLNNKHQPRQVISSKHRVSSSSQEDVQTSSSISKGATEEETWTLMILTSPKTSCKVWAEFLACKAFPTSNRDSTKTSQILRTASTSMGSCQTSKTCWMDFKTNTLGFKSTLTETCSSQQDRDNNMATDNSSSSRSSNGETSNSTTTDNKCPQELNSATRLRTIIIFNNNSSFTTKIPTGKRNRQLMRMVCLCNLLKRSETLLMQYPASSSKRKRKAQTKKNPKLQTAAQFASTICRLARWSKLWLVLTSFTQVA